MASDKLILLRVQADSIALGQLDVRGRRVLELGAGTGIPGLLCAREGAEQVGPCIGSPRSALELIRRRIQVVLSDFDDAELVKNLQANIVRGLPDQSELQAKVHVAGHSWGDSCDKLQQFASPSLNSDPSPRRADVLTRLADLAPPAPTTRSS